MTLHSSVPGHPAKAQTGSELSPLHGWALEGRVRGSTAAPSVPPGAHFKQAPRASPQGAGLGGTEHLRVPVWRSLRSTAQRARWFCAPLSSIFYILPSIL